MTQPVHSRPRTWAVLFLWLLIAGTAKESRADLRARDAWNLLIPHEAVERAVWWNGLIAGADDGGGLYFFDPSTGEIESFTTREGLTTNRTSDLAVDDDGNLWVATLGGNLIRIDPAFDPDLVTGLLSPSPRAIATDGDVVYYGSEEGGGRVVSGLSEFTFTEDDGLVSNNITALAAYQNLAWFGTDSGFSEFSRVLNAFATRNDGLPFGTPVVNDVLADALGVVGVVEDDVYSYNPADSTWSLLGTGLTQAVREVVRSGQDLLALTTTDTVYRLPGGSSAWVQVSLDPGGTRLESIAVTPAGELWFGGSVIDNTRTGNEKSAAFWGPSLSGPVVRRGLHGSQPRGLAVDGAGGVWAGTFPSRSGLTHWRADGTVVAYNIAEDTGAGIDGWCGTQAMVVVLRASNGDIWVSSLGNCLTRMRPAASDDPAEATYESFSTANSPLRSRKVIRIAEDPQGRIWFLSDGSGQDPLFDKGIDILLDPDNASAPASWLKLDLTNSGLEADDLRGVTFGGRGVAWLSVNGVGIQRWDYDGFDDDGVIRTENSPAWWQILDDSRLEISLNNPRGVRIASNGDLWVATNDQGVVRFAYNGGILDQVDRANFSTFGPSLLSNQVRSIALDNNGHLWCGTDAGLNRVRGTGPDLTIDAWTDFAAFDARNLGQSYLPDIISPLPGSNVQRLVFDAARNRLFIATQTGGAWLEVGGVQLPPPDDLDVVIYPNPLRADDNWFRITGFEGEVSVEIYNLMGVLIATRSDVSDRGDIWDAKDFSGNPVASGMYIARVIQDGSSVQRTLAIER